MEMAISFLMTIVDNKLEEQIQKKATNKHKTREQNRERTIIITVI